MAFGSSSLGCLCVALVLGWVRALLLAGDVGAVSGDRDLSKAILEMLHIDKLSAPRQAEPHPYMKQVYLLLGTQEAADLGAADGTLVQSFRSTQGSKYGTPGWIWFNVSHLKPSMAVAELVLLRKTLHPEPLSLTVAVHSLSPAAGNPSASGPLAERLLTLDQLPPSGYDVFDVSAALAEEWPPGALGFRLRFGDEGGSLVLHDALTQSLYCLNGSTPSQPLLVAYRARPLELREGARGASARSSARRQRQHCRGSAAHQRPPPRHSRRSAAGPACRLHRRYVDVRASGLAPWILQPAGFNVSFCRGTCNSETSKVAVDIHRPKRRNGVKDSLHSSHCIPQKLSSLTVMYRGDTDDIIIEKFKHARAESCVCLPNDYQ